MRNSEHLISAKSGRVHLNMSYPSCDNKQITLIFRLHDSQIQCQIDGESSFTVSLDAAQQQWMVLFHAERERFVSEKVNISETGTRYAFARALSETPLASNIVLRERVLDNICAFAKSVNSLIEPGCQLW